MYQDFQNKIIKFIPYDKALHFVFGFILYVIINCFTSDRDSFLIIFLVAVIKEIRDELVYNGFDWKDILATILPGIIITTLY